VLERQSETMPFACSALGVEGKQLGSSVSDLLGCLTPRLVPLTGTELVQRGMFGIRTAVARNQMQLSNRNVQGAATCIFQVKEFHGAFTEIHLLETDVAADTVLSVNHRIAFAQLGQIAHHGFDIAGALLRTPAAPHGTGLGGVKVVLSEKHYGFICQPKTDGEWCDEQRETGVA